MFDPKKTRPVLVIGATGYIGGRLVPKLLELGYTVRVMVRSLSRLESRPWSTQPRLDPVQGDMLDVNSLKNAVRGCWAAFYLAHSMNAPKSDFAYLDRLAAWNMVEASGGSTLERIIYLGGLGEEKDPTLSKHLRSRLEVARILCSGPVPVTALRAAMILGSGSASFEILRYLVDRLPVMLTPPWVHTPVQPICIRNVLNYLVGCLENEEVVGQVFDIGGPEILTYERLIKIYAQAAGLRKRIVIPVSFISPHMSALWIALVTPVPAQLAAALCEGLLNKVVCMDERIRKIIPQELMTCLQAIERAIEKIELQRVETCWTDAGEQFPPEWRYCGDAPYAGGTVLACAYRVRLKTSPREIWEHIVRIGAQTGWYFAGPLRRIRGWMDKLIGGTGLQRGRRDPMTLYVGDTLDFWRVLEVSAPFRLLLLSEMKLPGEAILEFRICPVGRGECELQQIARFLPKGFLGLLYWFSLYGAHRLLFKGMLRTIVREIGKPLVKGPERFAPKAELVCRID
ncbi:MAG: SDR family oxidoreductase [Syntrophobacteraceae bacterium]